MLEKECSHAATCPMFAMFKVAHALEVWKINYCRAAYERCARYQAAATGKPVPLALLPNGQLLRATATVGGT